MKWLFFLVVLLNAAFLSWHNFTQGDFGKTNEVVYAPPVSEKIRLLSEVRPEDQALNNKVVVSESIDKQLNKLADQKIASERDVFCPQLETERVSDKDQIINVLNEFSWPFSEEEIVGKRPKFWLYIAAPDTPKKAADIVKDLASKSIDSFVINRAEMKNRISLGLYSSKDRAETARISIQQRSGYKIDVYEHTRSVPLQKIIIRQPVDDKSWEQFMSRFDLTKLMIKVEKKSC